MKNTLLSILFLLSLSLNSFAQNNLPSCCQKPTKNADGMIAFADDAAFIAAHEPPLPFNYTDAAGKMITFSTPDGKTANAYEVKSATPTNNVLFVFHEYWGLNDYIKQRADELQKSIGNVNVIAVDIYDGKVASNSDTAAKYMSSLKDERVGNIIKGAIAYAGSSARIGTIGWCFGGGISFRATIAAGKQGIACVMYYGMPSKDQSELKKVHADVLGLFASQDKWINPDVVKQFQADMKTAGKNLTVKSYDADHAFANPSNPHYNKEASADANALALDFLKKHFAQK